MNRLSKILITLFICIIAAGIIWGITHFEPMYYKESDAFMPSDLKVNYVNDPIGVDPDEVTFSWKMDTHRVNMYQTAYRIEVNSDPSFKGWSYWDSGKVNSADSACIEYTGPVLRPETRYYWRVTVWDGNKEHKLSSENAFFETAADESSMQKAMLICGSEGNEDFNKFEISFTAAITDSALGFLAHVRSSSDFLLWQFNIADHGDLYLRKHFFSNGGYTVEEVNISKKCGSEISYGDKFDVKVTSDGKNIATYVNGNAVDSTKISEQSSGFFGFRQGANESGTVDNISTVYYLKNGEVKTLSYSFDDGINPFSFGEIVNGELVFNGASYEQRSYISLNDGKPKVESDGGIMFRKSFSLPETSGSRSVKKARLYVTALGNFNVYINGRAADDDKLKPGWTDYRERLSYYTYDIAPLLTSGENVICATVTSGWWNGAVSFGTYGNRDNAFLARIVVEYTDGRKYETVTDKTWEWNRNDCPVTYASIYGGETYDGRISATSYMPDEYDSSKWLPTQVFDGFSGVISPYSGTKIEVRSEYERKPESIVIYDGTTDNGSDYGAVNVISSFSGDNEFILNPGETAVIDLGQNMVGWPFISVSGNSGTEIVMKFGEMLNDSGKASRGNDGPEGSVYRANYRSAASTNRYILSGAEVENYHTEYSFYGFRYISITVSDTVRFRSVRGQVVGSANETTGFITTSDESVNKLISNIMWSMMGNYLSVPTDCPQRDERLGWTGDTQIFVGTGSYNADVASFFRKWLQDCIDSQLADGSYPDVVPYDAAAAGGGAAAWGDAGVIVPYVIYKKYGDIYTLKRNYDSMVEYMDFLISHGGPVARYGDWLSYEPTDQGLIIKAYYAYDALLMAEMSEALGLTKNAERYRELYEEIKSEYIQAYLNSVGMISTTQTGAILTLMAGLYPDDEVRDYIISDLLGSIRSNGNKLSTGFVGTASIVNVLSLLGNDEAAYTLLLQRGNPSWLYSVDQGATTTWERWDSYTKARGFGDVGMNSFNHYAYGCVGEWMYAYMAGINGYGTVAFKDFKLSPRPDPQKRIDHVKAEYESIYGLITSEWKINENGAFSYDFTIPANTSATVELKHAIGDSTYSKITAGGNIYEISELKHGDMICEGLYFDSAENGCIIIKAVNGIFSILLE